MAVVLALLLGPTPVAWTIRAQEWWSAGGIWIFRVIGGIRMEVRGRENILPTPAIYASKHQSVWDTVVFHDILDKPAIVLKKELLRFPLYAAHCRKAKMIPIDRSARASALRTLLKAARAVIDEGRPIQIFPEGTRLAPGTSGPLFPGTYALYKQLKIPVVPVALNSGVYWPRDSWRRFPGTIVIEFLPPLPAGLTRAEFTGRLKNDLNEAAERLLAEARQQPPAPVDN